MVALDDDDGFWWWWWLVECLVMMTFPKGKHTFQRSQTHQQWHCAFFVYMLKFGCIFSSSSIYIFWKTKTLNFVSFLGTGFGKMILWLMWREIIRFMDFFVGEFPRNLPWLMIFLSFFWCGVAFFVALVECFHLNLNLKWFRLWLLENH